MPWQRSTRIDHCVSYDGSHKEFWIRFWTSAKLCALTAVGLQWVYALSLADSLEWLRIKVREGLLNLSSRGAGPRMRIVLIIKPGYPHKRRQNAASKIRIVCIFAGVFFIGALWVSGYRMARWRCQKWIPQRKITPVHRLLLWVVRLPKDLLLIMWRSLYKVNVKCIKKIITESVFCITNAPFKTWNVCENADDPYLWGCIGLRLRRRSSLMKTILILGPAPLLLNAT